MREVTLERGGNVKHGCHTGCVIQCSRYWVDKDGHYKTKGMEYESVWSLGAELRHRRSGRGRPSSTARAATSASTRSRWARRSPSTWSPARSSSATPRARSRRSRRSAPDSELGTTLGNGAEAVGKKYGVTRIPVVKHQAMPAYDPRPIQGIGVTYATSTMGADHTAGYAITANILARRRQRRPAVAGGPGRAVAGPADRDGDARRDGAVHLRRVRGARQARGARRHRRDGHGAHRQGLDDRRADAARQEGRSPTSGCSTTRPASPPPTTVCRRTCTPRSCRRTTWSSRCRTPSSTASSTSFPRPPLAWALPELTGMITIELALFAKLSSRYPVAGSGRSARPVRGRRRHDRRRRSSSCSGSTDEQRITFVNGRHAADEPRPRRGRPARHLPAGRRRLARGAADPARVHRRPGRVRARLARGDRRHHRRWAGSARTPR